MPKKYETYQEALEDLNRAWDDLVKEVKLAMNLGSFLFVLSLCFGSAVMFLLFKFLGWMK